MAKHNMKAKYIIKQKVNYREEDEIINKALSCTELICNEYQTDKDSTIDLSRSKRDTGLQYRWQQKDDVREFIPNPVAQPEYGTVYKHQGMLLQNLHRHYLYMSCHQALRRTQWWLRTFDASSEEAGQL